jgi:hypothetical protein
MEVQDKEAGIVPKVPLSMHEIEQQEVPQEQRENEEMAVVCSVVEPLQKKSVLVIKTSSSFGDDNDDPGQRRNERCTRNNMCGSKCYDTFARRRPRMYAMMFGFLLPLLSLVGLAALCGYPLALMEQPIEVQQNDAKMAQHMRFLVQASLYTNFTQQIPQICLKHRWNNITTADYIDDDGLYWLFETQQLLLRDENHSITTLLETVATSGGVASVKEDSLETIVDSMWNYFFLPNLVTPADYEDAINATELTQHVSECVEELQPLLDKMFITLMKTAQKALSERASFAWTMCPANTTDMPSPDAIPPSRLLDYVLSMHPPANNDVYNPFLVSLVSHSCSNR